MPAIKSTVLAGLKDTVPFSLGVFAYGTVYGILSRAGHLTLAQTLSMSVLVFAGASQFVALALFKQGATGLAVVLATFFVNLRQVLYGLSLGPHLKGSGRGKLALLAYGLTDESYGVTMVAFAGGRGSPGYFLGAGLGVFGPWLAASLTGFFLAAFLRDPLRWGLDFAFIGAFMGLLVSQINSRLLVGVAVASSLVAVGAWFFLGSGWSVAAGALTACLLGVVSGEA
ncbi:MAG TPA: AzlC family ABC transporter permease [Spirochaetia bacterium]|nr:AzlC family ABC transporter permease [Spirochaetia bacterium]